MWVVVGIAGVTCGGKTTLAEEVVKALPRFKVAVVSVDQYFLPKHDPRHVRMPRLGYINWELTNSLDVERLVRDIRDILSKEDEDRILLIDGHTCLNIPQVAALCHVKYFFTLDREVCLERRLARRYQKKDKPEYFEEVVWPSYVRHRTQVEEEHYRDVRVLVGTSALRDLVARVKGELVQEVEKTRERCA